MQPQREAGDYKSDCLIPKVRPVHSHGYFERKAVSIAVLDRDELKRQIKHFHGSFKLDFTDDFLDAVSLDRLRHILLAALITGRSPH